MEEGTFPPSPGTGVPNREGNWETPSNVYQAQEFGNQAPVVNPESVKPGQVNPVVYRSDNSVPGSGGKKTRKFPIKKLLIGVLGIFLALIIIIIVFSVFSSGNKELPANDITLTYWGVYEDENVIRPILNQFEQENPNIKIVYEKQDLADYKDRIIARTDNGKGPDVFRYHNTWYPTISGYLLPLPNEVIKKDDFKSKYYDVAKTDLIKDGVIYGIPLYTDTLALYINNDIFIGTESANSIAIPKSWVEFAIAAQKLTKRNDRGAIEIAGAGMGTYDNVKYAPDILSLLMAQNGVDLNNPSAYQEEIAEAIKYYTNYSLIAESVWDNTMDNSQIAFAQGRLAMYFGYSWDYFEIKAKNPNINMIVVPVPQLITEDPVNLASYWAEGINAQTKHPKEAFKFMEFLSRGETQEKFYEEAKKSRDFGEPYSITGLGDKLKDAVPFVFINQSKTAISSPFVDVGGDKTINSELNEFLKTAVNDVLDLKSEDGAVESLVGGYTQTVGSYLGNQNK